MAVVSIILTAKNAASEAFNKVRGEMASTAEEAKDMATGISHANEAMSKAMRGDLVGAAKSASAAIKALWAALVANPFLAVAAAIGAATVALIKWHYATKQAAADQAMANAKFEDTSRIINEIENGTRLERETAQALKATYEELTAELQKHAAMAQQKKQLALEAAEAAANANEKEREAAQAWAQEKVKIYQEEMAIVEMLRKQIDVKSKTESAASKVVVENLKAEAEQSVSTAAEREDANKKMAARLSDVQDTIVKKVVSSHKEMESAETEHADTVVEINQSAADRVGETWDQIWRRRLAQSRGGKDLPDGVYDLGGSSQSSTNSGWLQEFRNRQESYYGAGMLFRPPPFGSSTGTRSPAKNKTDGEAEIVSELKGLRADQQRLMRMG